MPRMTIEKSLVRGVDLVRFNYNESLKEIIKAYPGSQWRPNLKAWAVDSALRGELSDLCSHYGYVFDCPQELKKSYSLHPELHSYQVEAATKAIDNRSHMLAFEMGCISADSNIDTYVNGKRIARARFRDLYQWAQEGKRLQVSSKIGSNWVHKNIIEAVIYQGKKQVWAVETDYDGIFECTMDHEIATPNGYVPLEKLKEGDRIECRRGTATFYGVLRHITGPRWADVYDLKMAAPHHNFVVSTVLVHNCGKTATAISALKEVGPQKTLIVAPAIARSVWAEQYDVWWKNHPEIGVLWPGTDPKEVIDCPIVVTSYELIDKIYKEKPEGWDAIVLDEIHYVQSGSWKGIGEKGGGAKRTKYLNELRKLNRNSFRLGLTGTPVWTQPKQLYAQWDWLWPTRFGYYMKFANRYCNVEDTGFVTASGNMAKKVYGINECYSKELQTRLADGMSRVTKAEVAHLLPSLTTEVLRVTIPKRFNPQEMIDRFINCDQHKIKAEEFVKEHSNHKIGTVAELAFTAAQGSSRVAVMTYLHHTAHLIAKEINALGWPAEVFTGEQSSKNRIEDIKGAIANPEHPIAVISMASVRESIDLTAFSTVYFAEIYPSPGLMEQVCGRFHRLNSKMPVFIYFVVIAGSYEEQVSSRLVSRMKDASSLYAAGLSASKTIDAFTDKRSDEEFLEYLNNLVK